MYVCSNGLIFYSANYSTTLCFKYITISKFQSITYLYIVFTFILCGLWLGEPVYFSDFLGACIIIGFQYYNLKYPPGKTPNKVIWDLNKKENNIGLVNDS